MKRIFSSAVLVLLFACGGSSLRRRSPSRPAASARGSRGRGRRGAARAAPEPTPEEKKKAEAQKKLAADRAKWEDDNKAEVARWTPEMHAAAKALAEKTYPSLKAALKAALAGHARASRATPTATSIRHPAETLDVLRHQADDDGARGRPGRGLVHRAPRADARGEGASYSTRIDDPNGPADSRGTFYGQRFKAFLDKAPELYGKVQTIVVDGKAPKLGARRQGRRGPPDARGPRHGQRQHARRLARRDPQGRSSRAASSASRSTARTPTRTPTESSKKGYLPEKWLVDHVEARRLQARGQVRDQREPQGHQGLLRGRVGASADARSSGTRTATSTSPSARATG